MRTNGYRPTNRLTRDERGLGAAKAIGALLVLGVVFLSIFLMSATSKPAGNNGNNQQNQPAENQATSNSNEPAFIRIPENSRIYRSSQYKFSFAYPESFGDLTDVSGANNVSSIVLAAESALANQKPIGGSSAAFLNGKFGVYVYKKEDFKVIISRTSDTFVGPTKTGNDITWKIVSIGNSSADFSIGQAFPVSKVVSQTRVPVFNFTLKQSTDVFGRWVFAAGDYYVVIAMPTISRPSGAALTDQDVAAYNVIGNNIAKTTRVQATSSAATDQNGTTGTNSNTNGTSN